MNYLLPGILLHHGCFGRLLCRIPALPGYEERHPRAIPIHADRMVVRAVGTRGDLAGRRSDLARGRRLVALLMGFGSESGVLAWLAVVGILILFTLALTWIAVIPGLSAKSADGAVAFSYPLIFLPFISSAFVPTDTMPGQVRAFAEYQR